MMRGPSYDDDYIGRKMAHIAGPTFTTPGPMSYGRPPYGGYMQDSPYSSYSASTTITPETTEVREERRSISPPPPSYRPSASTQLILNRVALGDSLLPPRSYPLSRYVPRYYPSYLDYDYGYGGYYYPYLYPRHSRYDYLDDLDSPYLSTTTTYRPRAIDLDTDYRDKAALATTKTTKTREEDDSKALVPKFERPVRKVKPQASPLSEDLPGEIEGESRVTRMERRYPRISEPQMLQDHVENMRHRLKSLAYSLDPTGPVPEIIIPERTTTKKSSAVVPAPEEKKYSTALEYTELPKLASRRQRYYPEDEHLKDNLRIQCLSHYKTTRTAADYPKTRLYDSAGSDYWKPKQYIPTEPLSVMPDTSSYRANKYSSTKWEEPDTVFGGPSDKKPYSKAITDGTSEEAGEERKERRKKKKSKEREVTETTIEATSTSITAAAAADHSTSEADPVSAPIEGDDEEKERKKLEKKKRKAEREAAAKAAMEAELAALAAAEAELARLEAESSKTDAPAEAAPAEAAPTEAAPAEVKSESAAEKCESSTEVVCEGVCVKPESLDELAPSQTPPQVPPQEEPEAPQVHEEPQAAPETEQAVEPQTEEPQPEIPEEEAIMEDLPPLKESQVELPPVEEPQVEPPVEETPVEEPPAEEPPVEEPPVEATPEVSPVEPPVEEAPVESSVEPPVEEAPAEALFEEKQIEEPQTEPALEEPQETSVEEPVEKAEEPSPAPRRRAAFDEDSGWLDAWDGEAAAPEAGAQEAGQQLG